MLDGLGSREYAAIFLALGVLALLLAAGFRTQDLLLAGLTLGLYGLHLVSMRSLREKQERQSALLREVGAALDDLSGPASADSASAEADAAGSGSGTPGGHGAPASAGSAGRGADDGHGADAGPGEGKRSRRGNGERSAPGDRTVRRKLRMGTVAIVEGALEPREVARVMSVKEQKPGKSFGTVAVEMGLLDAGQVEDLQETRETGLYPERRLKEAKRELRAFLRARNR